METEGKVVFFNDYLQRKRNSQPSTEKLTVFYVSERARWLDLLKTFPFLDIQDIRSKEELQRKLNTTSPGLVILECTLEWACTIETIDRLDYLLEVPILLIKGRAGSKKGPGWLKQAFAAGLCDTLYEPVCRQDIEDSLNILLKLFPLEMSP